MEICTQTLFFHSPFIIFQIVCLLGFILFHCIYQPLSIHHTCCHQQLLTQQIDHQENTGDSMSTICTTKKSQEHSPPSLSSTSSKTSVSVKQEEHSLINQTETTRVQQPTNRNVHRNHSQLIAVGTNSNVSDIFIENHAKVQVFDLIAEPINK